MAVELGTAASFKFSKSLFRLDDGSPITFYSDYQLDELQSIIHKGGGCLINHPGGAKILLCEKRTDNKIRNGYLPFDFIVDCVKRNSFLNVDNYRAERLGLKASTSSCEVSTSDANGRHEETDMVNISGNSRITVKASDMQGRKKYSDLDDLKIIKYLINHAKYSETGGNLVWKQMEAVKVTDHSHQSMKARFKKQIIPKIDNYNIPEDWIEKLCGDYCSDTSENDMELNGHVKSFDDIDAWKNEEKRLKLPVNSRVPVSAEKDSREPCDVSPAKSSLISSKLPATVSVARQHSRAINKSIVTAEVYSNGLVSTHMTKETSDEIESAVPHEIESNNCEPPSAQIDIHEGSSVSQVSISHEDIPETQGFDYDEIDRLVLSEANKSRAIVDLDKNNKQSNISTAAFTSRKIVKEMINCDECSPTKQINLRSQSFTNKEENGNIVEVDNSPGKSTRHLSALKEKRMPENGGPSSKQQIVSDGHVDEISKECTNSLSKIINIIGKDSFNSKQTNKLLPPRDSNLKQQNNEMDIQHLHKLTPTKESVKNSNNSNISPETNFLDPQIVVIRQDDASVLDKNNSETSCQNFSLVSNTESMRTQKIVSSKPQSKSAGQEKKHISEQHTNTVTNLGKTRSSSSKIAERAAWSKDSSSDMNSEKMDSSGEERDSSHRHKKQSTKAVPVGENSAVNRTEARLKSKDQETEPVEDLSWCMKESTARKVKYLSEEYGLDIKEAAHLLLMHNGSFVSVIKYFES